MEPGRFGPDEETEAEGRAWRERRGLVAGPRWTSGSARGTLEVCLNPLEQAHPGVRFGLHPPPLAQGPALWDRELEAGRRAVERLAASGVGRAAALLRPDCPRLPFPALGLAYQDPLCSVRAETKLLTGKGVNFIVVSRDRFSASQLAKKISLEMNCLLVDPMQILESYYHANCKGYFIPPLIIEMLQKFLSKKFSQELCSALCIIRALLCYFKAQWDGLDLICESIASHKISALTEEVEDISRRATGGSYDVFTNYASARGSFDLEGGASPSRPSYNEVMLSQIEVLIERISGLDVNVGKESISKKQSLKKSDYLDPRVTERISKKSVDDKTNKDTPKQSTNLPSFKNDMEINDKTHPRSFSFKNEKSSSKGYKVQQNKVNLMEDEEITAPLRRSLPRSSDLENHPIIQFLKTEMLKSSCIGDIVNAVKEMPAAEADELISHILSMEDELLSDVDCSDYIKPVSESVASMNFVGIEAVLAEKMKEAIESFDAYTRGYVIIYDSSVSQKTKNIWETIFKCLNPPDVIVFGQCPADEVRTTFESLRVNPFLPYEYFHYDFKENFANYVSFYTSVIEVDELYEIIDYINNKYKDKVIPIDESLLLEFLQIKRRRDFLCQLSDVCKRVKQWNCIDATAEGYHFDKGYEESYAWSPSEDLPEVILNLENYVGLPAVVKATLSRFSCVFNLDLLYMTSKKNYHPTCVVRTDARTPVCFQYSVVKRWFDYSGLYSKPRARCGKTAKDSIVCELIGRDIEQQKLNEEFLLQMKEKEQELNLHISAQHEEEDEEEGTELDFITNKAVTMDDIYGMEEEIEATVLTKEEKSSTLSSLSEFEKLSKFRHLDEFYYLRQRYEDKFSFLVDLQELNMRDDPLFFRTYQCNLTVWEDRCPVAHHEGKCRLGSLNYAVRLHDKAYLMSSLQAMKAFMYQPARYLVPILPASQCAVLLVGGHTLARFYLAEAIATFFEATVIDYNSVIERAQQELRNIYLQFVNGEFTSLLKAIFSQNIPPSYKNDCEKLEEWLEKAYQLILFRKLIFKPIFWDIYPPELYDDPDEDMYTISEFYPPLNAPFDLNKLCKRAQLKDLVLDVFFKTFQKYSDYMNIEPYFLKDSPEEILNYDILLDTLLREQFKNLGLIDIYGSYDLCDLYAWYPYRLLERLPTDLIPRFEPIRLEDEVDIRNALGQYLFPLNTIPLSVKEKIDALGKEIILIENKARFSGALSYGGYVINGMPFNKKLFKALSKAGIFPRNIVFLDDPGYFYNLFAQLHEDEISRMADIEKNLFCYVSPKLRNEVFPTRMKTTFNSTYDKFKKLTDKIKDNSIQNLGCKIARTYEKLQAFIKFNYYLTKNSDSLRWPGEQGLKHHLGRNNMYDSLSMHQDYNVTSILGIQKALDLLELIYTKYGRSHFKPFDSLDVIHSSTASVFRPYLYNSEKFTKKKNKNRCFYIMDSFFNIATEDSFSSECIKFSSFKFFYEGSNFKNLPEYPQMDKDFSYLYHLAYAIENSMLMSQDLNKIFKEIHKMLKNLGITLGIHNNFRPSYIEITRTTWEEKEKNRRLMHIEKRLRIHSKIIDYDYIMSRILELEKTKKKREKLSGNSDISGNKPVSCSDHHFSLSQSLTTIKSNDNKVQHMGIKALRTILEFDSSILMSTSDDFSKFILYFPKNLTFMSDEERSYDMCLITNRKYNKTQEIIDKENDLNSLLIVFDENSWVDWNFVQEEDFGDLLNFWGRENRKDNFNFSNFKTSHFERISKEKGFHFLKKVVSIQNRIEVLRKKKMECIYTTEEKLMLDYLVWIRNEYFKRSSLGILDVPHKLFEEDVLNTSFSSWLPNFSTFRQSFLTKKNEKPQSFSSETWPFRSNYKNFPRFIGIYDCNLWNEICHIRKKKTKFIMNNASLQEDTPPSVVIPVLRKPSIFSEQKKYKIKEIIDFLLHSLNVFKSHEFRQLENKLRIEKGFECKNLFYKCFQRKLSRISISRKSEIINQEDELLIKNKFFKLEGNDSLQKDGLKIPSSHKLKDKKGGIEELLNFMLESSVICKVNNETIADDVGPFNVLYSILNNIRGSRGLPRVTGTTLPIEEMSEIDGPAETFLSTKKSIEGKIRGTKENICVVSLFDGHVKYGLETLSVQVFGEMYYFCSQECFVRFRLFPAMFINLMNSYENVYPFNLLYLELPGGVGRNLCSLISYYFGTKVIYMDDFLVQRFRSRSKDRDIKAISLKGKLVTSFTSGSRKETDASEGFLWSYLIQESEIPNLSKMIKKCWKKDKYLCIYNFPHHPNDLKRIFEKCFIPNIIVKSTSESQKILMGFKNVDFIKSYAGDLYEDKSRIINIYFSDFKWWMKNWQRRFLKTFKMIKREEISQLISMLQYNLHCQLKPPSVDRFGMKEPDPEPVKLIAEWSKTSFPFYEYSKEEYSRTDSTEQDMFNVPSNLGKPQREIRDNSKSLELPICKEKSDSGHLYERSIFENMQEGLQNNSSELLKSDRFELPNINKWKKDSKPVFDYEQLKHLSNKSSFKKLCLIIKKQLQKEIDIELLFREKIKQTICSKKTFSDDETNLKSDIISVDSVGFEDYDNIKIENEDLNKENSLRMLSIALKHANALNPIPAPTLDKYYELVNTHDLNLFSTCQLQAYDATVNQFQSKFDGVDNPSFDVLNDSVHSLVNKIKMAKKQVRYSECVIEIDKDDVKELVETGYYFLSKFGRQCPVKSKRGSLYPQTSIIYDSSNCYPAVHRRYIYFISSKEALEVFKENPLDFVDLAEYNPPIPIHAVFFGPCTKRSTYIIKSLATEFSLEHITVTKALEYLIKRGNWSRLGQRLQWHFSYVFGLPFPERFPTSLLWQAMSTFISSPKSTTHGFILSGLKPTAELFQIWDQCNFKPHIIFYMTVDNPVVLGNQQRHDIMENFHSMGHKARHFQFIKTSYVLNLMGCSNNEVSTWETKACSNCIKFLQKHYYNVNLIQYYTSNHLLYQRMSSALLDLIKCIRSFYILSINENEDPLPVGNLMTYKNFSLVKDVCWEDACPVCVCISGRYLKNDSMAFESNIIFAEGKGYWVCQKHTTVFLSTPKQYINSLNLMLCLPSGLSANLLSINPKEINYSFSGFCPVCYWLQKPHVEYQYRRGCYIYTQVYDGEAYKFCSEFCLSEFKSAPWLYVFLGKCKIEDNALPQVDTKCWSVCEMKTLGERNHWVYLRDVKGVFFYNLLRLAANVDIICPGLTKREARIFLIHALARRYISGPSEADKWKLVIVEFLAQSGVSKRILNKFFFCEERDLEMSDLLEYFVSKLTK